MEVLFLLVPFLTYAIMQGIKKLAGLYSRLNGTSQRGWLRAVLVII
jgi:hypothetical protein